MNSVELRSTSGSAVRARPPTTGPTKVRDPPMSTKAMRLTLRSKVPWREFQVLTVSFDANETPALAAQKKKQYVERYGRPTGAAGWHFLTGDQASIDALTKAVGFRYTWDADTRQWAHPAGILVLTPEGRIARYLYGIEYAPNDLRLALVEAASGRIGNVVDQAILFCYQYDPATGRYGAAIMRVVRTGGVLTVLAIAAFILTMLRRERLAAAAHAVAGES